MWFLFSTISLWVYKSGKRLHIYGKSPFLKLRKSTISMAMFNSKLFVYQRVIMILQHYIPLYHYKISMNLLLSWLYSIIFHYITIYFTIISLYHYTFSHHLPCIVMTIVLRVACRVRGILHGRAPHFSGGASSRRGAVSSRGCPKSCHGWPCLYWNKHGDLGIPHYLFIYIYRYIYIYICTHR